MTSGLLLQGLQALGGHHLGNKQKLYTTTVYALTFAGLNFLGS